MGALLPYLCFAFIFLAFYNGTNRYRIHPCWRTSFLSASLTWGILLTGITELLSVFNGLTIEWLTALWSLATFASALSSFALAKKITKRSLLYQFPPLPPFFVFLLIAVVSISLTLAFIAITAAPNNYDSMVYHLARVVHWIQNRSVAHYATHTPTQLFMPPWAEFHILHLQILCGNDRFAALPQWFAMIGCLSGVSLIAKHFGADTRGQIFAAVFSATLPMGILQATSTQNDYVVSFWLICLGHSTIQLTKTLRWRHSLATGASVGLAILTKGTAYIYAFPFLLWLVLHLLLNRSSLLKTCEILLIIAVLGIGVNVGHYCRNTLLFGSPLGEWPDRTAVGPPEEWSPSVANDIFTIQTVASNIIRNIALHIGTPSNRVNKVMDKGIRRLHRLLGADADESATTWKEEKFRIRGFSRSEGEAGNPVHLMLILAFSFKWLWRRRMGANTSTIYSICVVSAFVLFCLYLKWQPWHSRLHLPVYVLSSPLIGLAVGQTGKDWCGKLIMIGLIILSLWWVPQNYNRPLIGGNSILATPREQQYFVERKLFMGSYVSAAKIIDSYKDVGKEIDLGLAIAKDSWEYPFWILQNKDGDWMGRIEHVDVRNVSRLRAKSDFEPDVIVGTGERLVRLPEFKNSDWSLHKSGGLCVLANERRGDLLTRKTSWRYQHGKVDLLLKEGRYSDAIEIAGEALKVAEAAIVVEDVDFATLLEDLAWAYDRIGKNAEAGALLERALEIKEKIFGLDHPDVDRSVNRLATLYGLQGRYAKAESLYKRLLATRERTLGRDHREVVKALKDLAELYYAQGKYTEAEPLCRRVLAIDEKAFGPDNVVIVGSLHHLAELYWRQDKYADAEALYKRELAIWEDTLGPDHPNVARPLNDVAKLYRIQGRYSEVEPLHRRSLAILEEGLGPDHPDVAVVLEEYADSLRKVGRTKEAESMEARAEKIRSKR